MNRSVLVLGAVLAAASLSTATAYAQPPAKPQPSTAQTAKADAKAAPLSVTVTYTGKGTVDPSKDIIVFLFSTPEVNPNSRPIVHKSVPKNGGTVSFEGLPDGPIYLFALYDKEGNYTGTEGPPPPGTPVGMYSAKPKGDATPVKPGTKVKFSFDDSHLWK